jgi:hypothetical protein
LTFHARTQIESLARNLSIRVNVATLALWVIARRQVTRWSGGILRLNIARVRPGARASVCPRILVAHVFRAQVL